MNANEKIYVRRYIAHTAEDDYEKGEIENGHAMWDSKDIPVEGRFDTIAEALEAVCESNCFTYKPEWWENWAKDFGESEAGRFSCSWLVDVNNYEADESDIEAWKRGEKRLWDCTIDVWLGVRTERDLAPEECAA